MSTTPPREHETRAPEQKPEDKAPDADELSAEQLDKVSGGTSNVQKAEHDTRMSVIRNIR
jgi:hypothetical protein